MKKTLVFALILGIIIAVFPVSNASALVFDGLVFSVINNEAWVVSGDNASGEVIIPNTVDGYPVTHISEDAFWCNSNIEKIVLPNNITVGRYAFANCTGIEEIVFSSTGTTVLEEGAFSCCSNVTDINFNKGEVVIGPSAFIGCIDIEELKIGPGVKTIGEDAFDLCNLDKITVDAKNPYFSSDNSGILYNKNKTELLICPIGYSKEVFNLPSSVTAIARKAFSGCWIIETINIHSKVEKIDSTAFMDCYNLEKINVDAKNSYFSSDSYGVVYNKNKTELLKFPDSSSYVKYKIPAGTVKIGDYAFYQCENLSDVTFPNGLQSIGTEAFSGCDNLTKALLPDTVDYIGSYAFYKCSKMTDFDFGGNIEQINEGIFTFCYALKSIEIPETVTSIGNSAFFACSGLTEIVIPKNVVWIGTWVFYDCTKLSSVRLPASLQTIGEYAFRDCTSLKTVYYEGTERQWDFILISYGNDPLISAELVCEKVELISNGVYLVAPNDSVNSNQNFTANIIADHTKDFDLMQYFNPENTVFYNLSLENSSRQSAEYTVSIPIPEGAQAENIKILKLNGQGNATVVPSTATGYYCTFTVNGLGNFAVAEKNGKFLSGDFDDDFSVTLQDVVVLAQICADWNIQYNENNLDVNGDGFSDLQDVVLLSQYVAGWNDVVLK